MRCKLEVPRPRQIATRTCKIGTIATPTRTFLTAYYALFGNLRAPVSPFIRYLIFCDFIQTRLDEKCLTMYLFSDIPSAAKENLEDQTWSPIPGALLSQVGWKQLGGFPCICETKAGDWSRRADDLWRTGVNTLN